MTTKIPQNSGDVSKDTSITPSIKEEQSKVQELIKKFDRARDPDAQKANALGKALLTLKEQKSEAVRPKIKAEIQKPDKEPQVGEISKEILSSSTLGEIDGGELAKTLKKWEEELEIYANQPKIITRIEDAFELVDSKIEELLKSVPKSSSQEIPASTEIKTETPKGRARANALIDYEGIKEKKEDSELSGIQKVLDKLGTDKVLVQMDRKIEIREKSKKEIFLNFFFRNRHKRENEKPLASILSALNYYMYLGKTHFTDENGNKHEVQKLYNDFFATTYVQNLIKHSRSFASLVGTQQLGMMDRNSKHILNMLDTQIRTTDPSEINEKKQIISAVSARYSERTSEFFKLMDRKATGEKILNFINEIHEENAQFSSIKTHLNIIKANKIFLNLIPKEINTLEQDLVEINKMVTTLSLYPGEAIKNSKDSIELVIDELKHREVEAVSVGASKNLNIAGLFLKDVSRATYKLNGKELTDFNLSKDQQCDLVLSPLLDLFDDQQVTNMTKLLVQFQALSFGQYLYNALKIFATNAGYGNQSGDSEIPKKTVVYEIEKKGDLINLKLNYTLQTTNVDGQRLGYIALQRSISMTKEQLGKDWSKTDDHPQFEVVDHISPYFNTEQEAFDFASQKFKKYPFQAKI